MIGVFFWFIVILWYLSAFCFVSSPFCFFGALVGNGRIVVFSVFILVVLFVKLLFVFLFFVFLRQ